MIGIISRQNEKYHFFSSNCTEPVDAEKKDPINVYLQFYIDKNTDRYTEVKYTLKKNVENDAIDNIYLLNEREYSIEELGTKSKKIQQIVIDRRLKYEDFFKYSKDHIGYLVFVNADILFDDTIKNLYYSGIDQKKMCYCLLRHEKYGELFWHRESLLKEIKLQMKWNYDLSKKNITNITDNEYSFSSDTWIIHSKFNQNITNMNIPLGITGCDNRFHYEMMLNGFDIINEPYFIKTYHNHKTNVRNYKTKDALKGNYLCIIPNLKPFKKYYQ